MEKSKRIVVLGSNVYTIDLKTIMSIEVLKCAFTRNDTFVIKLMHIKNIVNFYGVITFIKKNKISADIINLQDLDSLGVMYNIKNGIIHRKSDSCSICLEDLEDDLVYTLCGHTYHKKCISRWQKNKNNCPLCRKKIEKYNYRTQTKTSTILEKFLIMLYST
jgi:hypothetical protein